MTDVLKPCPFCGGEVNFGYFATTPNIDCPQCEYARDFGDGENPVPEAEAIAAWNTRAAPRVKPLVWEQDQYGDFYAKFGDITYAIFSKKDDKFWWDCDLRGVQMDTGGMIVADSFESVEAAKVHCEANRWRFLGDIWI